MRLNGLAVRLAQWAESLRLVMGGVPPSLQAAALPYRITGRNVEYLLITSRRTRRWILPKGKIEKHEGTAEAARREAFEEAGIIGEVDPEPIGVYDSRKYLGAGATIPIRIIVHAIAVSELADNFPEAGERDLQWMSPEQAAGSVHERHLSSLFVPAAKKLLD